MMRSFIAAFLLATASLANATEPVSVVLADPDNLQDLPFFVAIGAGYFRDEGLTVTIQTPDAPSETTKLLHAGTQQIAILPPPIYLQLIADHFPMRIVANLLRNDPIDLVVRRSLIESHHIPMNASVHDRLVALSGLRLGVAPGPVSRLHALFRSQGLDADKVITVVTLMGQQQNDAFASGKVDALYAHTPYLERALVQQEAVLVVNQSAGEVPQLATRMIHALVVSDEMVRQRPKTVAKMVSALARAERLIHADGKQTVLALLQAIPSRPKELLEQIVQIYAPAVPETPEISRDGLRSALTLFPATRVAPKLSDAELDKYIDNSFCRALPRSTRRSLRYSKSSVHE
jgi:ABC-type nitrate/sulfonate/bicarbonate transport system substrate-binding protein